MIKFISICYYVGILSYVTTIEQKAKWEDPWECVSNSKCVQVRDSQRNNWDGVYETQNICRLVCGRYGALWPQPTGSVVIQSKLIPTNPLSFNFEIDRTPDSTRKFLKNAVKIFQQNIKNDCGVNCNMASEFNVNVVIHVKSQATELFWGTDESYNLTVTNDQNIINVDIIGATMYGARHGLETLSQLLTHYQSKSTNSSGLIMVGTAFIKDKPSYTHRGLLLDTARNFISLKKIYQTLDGMASCKLNVFHWHATDSQSFPIEIKSIPQLTEYGAYSSKNVYSSQEIRDVIEYARQRGIRVLLELDAPAHAGNGWQWGPLYNMGNLTVCTNVQPWRSFCIQPPCGQFNPANPALYTVLRQVYKELAQYIPDEETLHMGGDEVFFPCWESIPEIVDLLYRQGRGTGTQDMLQLWAEFQTTVLSLWDEVKGRSFKSRDEFKQPSPVILWSSKLTNPDTITNYLQPNRYVIQTWVESDNPLPTKLMELGYKIIVSTKNSWYLDHGFWGNTKFYDWRKVYSNILPHGDKVLGGETCMWSELIDDTNLDSRVWPRTAAAAERLWTNSNVPVSFVESRMYRHRERLVNLGLDASPLAPKWCRLNDKACS